MSEQNPMSILLTIRDDGSYQMYSPTLGAFHVESWDVALETLADWQGRLKDWKHWTEKGSSYGLRAEIAKHISHVKANDQQ